MYKLTPENRAIIIAISGDTHPEKTFLGSYLMQWEKMLNRLAEDNHRRGFVGGYKAGETDAKEKFEACDAYQQGFTCGYDDGARENETPEIWEETTETTETTEFFEVPETFDDIPTEGEGEAYNKGLTEGIEIGKRRMKRRMAEQIRRIIPTD